MDLFFGSTSSGCDGSFFVDLVSVDVVDLFYESISVGSFFCGSISSGYSGSIL